MTGLYLSPGLYPQELFGQTTDYIHSLQRASGEIPWFEGGHTDPWDHVEAAMALTIGGKYAEAQRAYDWLVRTQEPDGSWWARFENGVKSDVSRRETNFCAYIATGVWHHYLCTRDRDFLETFWPCVERALEFVLSQQSPYGDINWAIDDDEEIPTDALVTGCSSIYKSLECAHNIALTLGHDKPYLAARARLGESLRSLPERYDRTWESKARYSMDWFYPVLTGVFQGRAAQERLLSRWSEFVEPELGCRCVSDEPWATIAETCELVMALLAAGDTAKAREVYSWVAQWRHEDGSYWTGYQFAEQVLWPDERPTWTAAAVMLAADALTQHTPASQLFTSVKLLDADSLASLNRARA